MQTRLVYLTVELILEQCVDNPVSEFSEAVTRALNYAMENDIAGAEVLSYQNVSFCGVVSSEEKSC